MRNTGRLYAFDTSAHRLEALKPRLARSGLSNIHPVAIAHERDERIKRLRGKMDRVWWTHLAPAWVLCDATPI
jgi:16S rRNA (cytosine967-C5)-methyltransferase